jgi:hypothetical protein
MILKFYHFVMTTHLSERHCRSCRGDIPRLEDPQQIAALHQQVCLLRSLALSLPLSLTERHDCYCNQIFLKISQEWEIIDGKKLRREWKVRNFAAVRNFLTISETFQHICLKQQFIVKCYITFFLYDSQGNGFSEQSGCNC